MFGRRPGRVVLQLDDAPRLVEAQREPDRRLRLGGLRLDREPDPKQDAVALGSRLLQSWAHAALELAAQRRKHLLAVVAAAGPVAVPTDVVGQQPLDDAQVVATHRLAQRLDRLFHPGAHSEIPCSIAYPRSRIRPAVASPPQNSAERNSSGETSLRAVISCSALNGSSSTRAQNLVW